MSFYFLQNNFWTSWMAEKSPISSLITYAISYLAASPQIFFSLTKIKHKQFFKYTMTFMPLYLCTCCFLCLNAHTTIGTNRDQPRTKVQASLHKGRAFSTATYCLFHLYLLCHSSGFVTVSLVVMGRGWVSDGEKAILLHLTKLFLNYFKYHG